jgi:hypothetical protein
MVKIMVKIIQQLLSSNTPWSVFFAPGHGVSGDFLRRSFS